MLQTTGEVPSFVLQTFRLHVSDIFCGRDRHPRTGPAERKVVTAMQQENVLLPIRWDAKKGSLLLGVPLTEKGGTASPKYILNDSLPYGVGQNDLGMDRGQIGIFSQASLSSRPPPGPL